MIATLKEQLENQIKELENKLNMLLLYPDIKESSNRWGNRFFTSPSVNKYVDKARIHHNCGCCDDSPLEVWPYLEVNGIAVFSDPPSFCVGEKNGIGDTPYEDWEKYLLDKDIPKIIIDKVVEHFEGNPIIDSEDNL